MCDPSIEAITAYQVGWCDYVMSSAVFVIAITAGGMRSWTLKRSNFARVMYSPFIISFFVPSIMLSAACLSEAPHGKKAAAK